MHVLVSGHANDSMWGNAVVTGPNITPGHNTFVFAPFNGNDTINDFHSGLDHIDLTADAAIGVHSFAKPEHPSCGKQQCHPIRRERFHYGGWQHPSTRCRFSIGLTIPCRKHCAAIAPRRRHFGCRFTSDRLMGWQTIPLPSSVR